MVMNFWFKEYGNDVYGSNYKTLLVTYNCSYSFFILFKVTFPEIEEFLFKKKGVDLQEEALGYQRTNIASFQEFLITLQV